jgi:hypothetical protein
MAAWAAQGWRSEDRRYKSKDNHKDKFEDNGNGAHPAERDGRYKFKSNGEALTGKDPSAGMKQGRRHQDDDAYCIVKCGS